MKIKFREYFNRDDTILSLDDAVEEICQKSYGGDGIEGDIKEAKDVGENISQMLGRLISRLESKKILDPEDICAILEVSDHQIIN